MNQNLPYRLIVLFVSNFIFNLAASAEENIVSGDQNIQQDAVIVTATRFETSIATAPVNTTVIDAQQISNSSATTISQALELLGGIYVKDLFGESDSKSSIDMGGFGATGTMNTLILLNGRRLNDADLAGVNLAALPLNAIQRIEIVHGNASVLYGDNATSGVINIVTKTGFDTQSKSAQLDAGSYKTRGIHLNYIESFNNFAAAVALNVKSSDGYRDNSAMLSKNAMTDFSYSGNDALYGIRLNISSENLDLPGSLDEATYVNDRTASNPTIEYLNEDRNTAELYLQQGQFAGEIGYRHRDQSSYLFGDINSDLSTVSVTPRYTYAIFQHTFVTGIDWYVSNLNVASDFIGSGGSLNKNDTVRDSMAAYVSDSVALNNNLSLNLGVRRQLVKIDIENTDTVATLSTKAMQTDSLNAWDVTLSNRFGSNYKGYIRYASGMRFPVLDEMWDYYYGTINLLKPQTSKHTEAGLQIRLPNDNKVDISVFHINLKNEIGFDAATFTNLNFDPTVHNGIDVSYLATLRPWWHLNTNLNWRKATFNDGAYDGNEIPEIPKLRGSLSQNFLLASRQQIEVDLVYTGERRFGDDFANQGKYMGGYTIVNTKYQKDVDIWSLAFNINNLTDKKTADLGQYLDFAANPYYYYPLPERSVVLTVSAKL